METKNQTSENLLVNQQKENKANLLDGIAHRMEVVKEDQTKIWINDSKSSCLESALYSLEEIGSEVLWIMGADQEEVDYKTFREFLPENVSQILLFGEKEGEWESVFKQMKIQHDYSRSLEEVVNKAKDINVGVILFSPATASFADYRNFRKRGEHFKTLVNEL